MMESKSAKVSTYLKGNKRQNPRTNPLTIIARFLLVFFTSLITFITLLNYVNNLSEEAHFQINTNPHLIADAAASVNSLSASGWISQTVDDSGMVGLYTSIALDNNNQPHISYYDDTNPANNLKYATWISATGWVSQTVDTAGSAGTFSSLALDGNGNPRISYHDFNSGNDDLKYTWWENGFGWHIEHVDMGGRVGKYTSLELDQSDNPHISYYDETNEDLKYAVWSSGSGWIVETVDSIGDVGRFTSLALDRNGNPHVSYYDASNTALKYATWNVAEGWISQTVTSTGNIGSHTSIFLDHNDNPRISYHDVVSGNLMYASWFSGTGWVIETVDNQDYVGWYTSLCLDSADNPHIGYYDLTNNRLKYAYWTAVTGWVVQVVDDTSLTGSHTSLALDSDDNPHISYYDSTYGQQALRYAWLDRLPLADSGGDYSVEEGSQIILDGSGSYPYDNPVYEWDMAFDGITFDVDAVGVAPLFDASNLDGPDQVTIALRVKDSNDFTDVHSNTIIVTNVAPTVTIVERPFTGFVDIPVSFSAIFTDTGVLDTHTSVWDFGDGNQIANILTPTHVFLSQGNFTVTLNVIDDDNGSGQDMVTVHIDIPQHQIFFPLIIGKTDP